MSECLHTLALGEESLLVLETMESNEIGDSQSPYGAVFLVVLVLVVLVLVVLDMVVVDVPSLVTKCGVRERTQV